MSAITAGTSFPTSLVTEMYSKVKGHSAIAKMIPSAPIPFNGQTEFTFSMDHSVEVVGESGNKSAGDATIASVTIRPVKVVYQSRVSNEFMYASEEARLDYLRTFADGFAKKLAEGIDEMILHGVNPYSGSAASGTIGNNHLDYIIANYNSGSNQVIYHHDSTTSEANLSEIAAKVEDPTGMIIGGTIRGDLETIYNTDASKAPLLSGFFMGGTPDALGSMVLDKTKAVESNSAKARAYVGDWSALKWGFAKEMPLEVIEYGNPDNAGDLKRMNQVVLRSEAFVGWGILDAAAFARVYVNP